MRNGAAEISSTTLNVIGRVYDVGLSASHWPEALDRITHHLGARGSAIFYQDTCHEELNAMITTWGDYWRNGRMEDYLAYAAKDEPSAELMHQAIPGEIITSETLPVEVMSAMSSFTKTMRDLFQINAYAAARLNDARHWFDYITFQYGEEHGPIQPTEHAQLQILLPHITKAMEISRPIALLEQRYRAVLDALDHLLIGLAVVSAPGSVLIANATAKSIFDTRDGLIIDAKATLHARHNQADATLQRALTAAIDTSAGQGAKASSALSAPRRSGADPYLVEVVPLNDSTGSISTGFHGAFVLIIDPNDTRHVSTRGISTIYGLTDSESAVCRHLVEGLTYAQIADARGVSPETVKSQVQAAFKKTRCKNRSMLVKLALSVNIPIDK